MLNTNFLIYPVFYEPVKADFHFVGGIDAYHEKLWKIAFFVLYSNNLFGTTTAHTQQSMQALRPPSARSICIDW